MTDKQKNQILLLRTLQALMIDKMSGDDKKKAVSRYGGRVRRFKAAVEKGTNASKEALKVAITAYSSKSGLSTAENTLYTAVVSEIGRRGERMETSATDLRKLFGI